MEKIIIPRSWNLGDSIAYMVKRSRNGIIGSDYSALVKRANAEFSHKIRNIEFLNGEIPVHVIAMGSTEGYGPNRNGDGFKEASLQRYHDTFVKHARHYRHHRNKDEAKSYGIVKASFYNPDMKRVELLLALNGTKEAASANGGLVADKEREMLERGDDLPVSMACFRAGASVRMWDDRRVPIEQISVGDEVYTHHGNKGEVTATSKRSYRGDFIRLTVAGFPDAVESTDTHKIWVRPTRKGKQPRCPVCQKQFKSLGCHLREQTDPQHKAAAKDYGRYAEGWFAANELAPGDQVRIPIDQTVTEVGDPVYAEILGFYLSEGNTWQYKRFEKTQNDTYRGVDFSFHIDEVDLADRVIAAAHALGYTRTHIYLRKNNVRLLRICSAELADRLELDGGRGAYNKTIADRIMTWAPITQKKILEAWLEGDGTFSKIHKTLVGVSVSRTLCRQMAEICWRNGIAARINRSYKSSKYDACTIRQSDVSKMQVSKIPDTFVAPCPVSRNCAQLRHQSAETVTKPYIGAKAETYIEGEFLFCRIRKVDRFYDECDVYNMTVETDNSYTINEIGVSNCKIAYDVCSSCQNRAASRDDYCDEDSCPHGGCKHNLTKVGEDGHILHVDNPHPTFFDISTVIRPADRIAYGGIADYLQKAASGEIQGGAALARAIGIVSPLSLATIGLTDQKIIHQIKLAYQLASIEDELESGPSNRDLTIAMAFSPEVQSSIDVTPLGRPGSMKCASGLNALASQKVALPVRDFIRLVLGESSVKLAELSDTVPGLLPGVYNRLLASGNLEDSIRNNPFAPSRELATATQREWATKLSNDHSLDVRQVQRRTSLAAIRGISPPTALQHVEKRASYASGEAEGLARRYALYKLAFVAEQNTDVALTANISIRQNYA